MTNNPYGILTQYLPLDLYQYEAIVNDDNDEVLLSQEHFEWIRYDQRRESSKESIYDGKPTIFCPYKYRAKKLIAMLDGELLRLPQVSYCLGEDSIMLTNELLGDIGLCPSLGIIQTPATIIDATQTTQEGYTALSFHKKFTLFQVNHHLSKLPINQRSLIQVALNQYSNLIFIHQSVIDKWRVKDIKEIKYDFTDDEKDLATILNGDYYCGDNKQYYYDSIKDYQLNNGTLE